MLGQSSFLDFCNKNKEKNAGWIRREWFKHTSGVKMKRRLFSVERIVLSILICVGLRDGAPLVSVRTMWRISDNEYYGQKKRLREKYVTFQSNQSQAPPVERINPSLLHPNYYESYHNGRHRLLFSVYQHNLQAGRKQGGRVLHERNPMTSIQRIQNCILQLQQLSIKWMTLVTK